MTNKDLPPLSQFFAASTKRAQHSRGAMACARVLARQLRPDLREALGEELFIAAALHEIGYSRSVKSSGYAPLDAASWASAAGLEDRIVAAILLVEGGSAGACEYEESIAQVCEQVEQALNETDQLLVDLVRFCDLSVGVDGSPTNPLKELRRRIERHGAKSVARKAMEKAGPVLEASIRRVQQMLEQDPA